MTMDSVFRTELRSLLGEGRLLTNEPLSEHTSFRIGGPCALMALPADVTALAGTVKLAREQKIPYYIMGNGTNLLCGDRGYQGIMIKTSGLNRVESEDGIITAQCGASLAKAAVTALGVSLTGLEFAHGIPGSVGGGVVMNAGAYGGELGDVAIQTVCIDENGEIKTLSGREHGFGYRKSVFSESRDIVLETKFRLEKGDSRLIKERMSELAARRRAAQPIDMPSAGSVFKRPEGHYAGRLIEDCGLKGMKIGGAQVSEKHCGFIINAGGATAGDVLELIDYIRRKVKERFGVFLETEIKLLA